MFGNLGISELLVLALAGFVIFGPNRLPKAASDAARLIRQVRRMAHGALDDVRAELGPEWADIDLRSLHPHQLIAQAIQGEEQKEEPAPAIRPTPSRSRTAAPKPRASRVSATTATTKRSPRKATPTKPKSAATAPRPARRPRPTASPEKAV